jgi:hypothetical protein
MIEERGPAMAMTPSMIILGSRKELVADVLLRSRGKSRDPSLATLSAYKDAAKLRDKPGLFFYADPAALEPQMERLAKEPGGVPHEWKVIQAALPPKAVRSATGMVSLQNGNLHLQTQINLVPGTKHALLNALPNRKVATELLAFAPRGTLLTSVVGFDDGAARWASLIKLLDNLAEVGGVRPGTLPSKRYEGLDEKLGMKFGKDVLGRISSAGLVLDIEEGKAPRTPMLLVRAKDGESATFLVEKALPKLIEATTDAKGSGPVVEKVLGQSITTVPGKLMPGWKSAHVGRQGPILVVGPDKTRVAESLILAGKKAGTLTDVRVSAALKGLNDPVAVGVVSLAQPLAARFKSSITPVQPRYKFKGSKDGPPRKPAPMKTPEYVEKGAKDMAKALSTLAPLVFSMERKTNTITLEVRQAEVRRAAGRAINVWVEGELQRSAYRASRPIPDEPPPEKFELKKE